MFTQHDPSKVFVSFGTVMVSGYASGSMVTIERAEDAFSMVVGAQGDTTRVRNRNRNGAVTVRLQAASPINDALSTYAALDESVGLGVAPIQVIDLNGTSVATSAFAWIRKLPSLDKGADAGDVEWVFDCHELEINVGGSVPVL